MIATYVPPSAHPDPGTDGCSDDGSQNGVTSVENVSVEQGFCVGNTEGYRMKKKDNLRKGKWTVEEERYTNKVIEAFNAGVLELSENERGVTLRAYLAEKLGCDPMRITKKYTGASCLGKRVYHAQKQGVKVEDIEQASVELHMLEQDFRQKLQQINRKRGNSSGSFGSDNHHMVTTPAIDALLNTGPHPYLNGSMPPNIHNVNKYPYPMPMYPPSNYPPGHLVDIQLLQQMYQQQHPHVPMETYQQHIRQQYQAQQEGMEASGGKIAHAQDEGKERGAVSSSSSAEAAAAVSTSKLKQALGLGNYLQQHQSSRYPVYLAGYPPAAAVAAGMVYPPHHRHYPHPEDLSGTAAAARVVPPLAGSGGGGPGGVPQNAVVLPGLYVGASRSHHSKGGSSSGSGGGGGGGGAGNPSSKKTTSNKQGVEAGGEACSTSSESQQSGRSSASNEETQEKFDESSRNIDPQHNNKNNKNDYNHSTGRGPVVDRALALNVNAEGTATSTASVTASVQDASVPVGLSPENSPDKDKLQYSSIDASIANNPSRTTAVASNSVTTTDMAETATMDENGVEQAKKKLKVTERDSEAASSLLGFFNQLERNNSQEDLVNFFEGVTKVASVSLSPTAAEKEEEAAGRKKKNRLADGTRTGGSNTATAPSSTINDNTRAEIEVAAVPASSNDSPDNGPAPVLEDD
mmetsp:Transcript_31056/g.52458  ORF Transcript_31056/g.52458 Transcript_31056/m.52458 type:complete len:689 (+) Transcript_31056:134-2200(+)